MEAAWNWQDCLAVRALPSFEVSCCLSSSDTIKSLPDAAVLVLFLLLLGLQLVAK